MIELPENILRARNQLELEVEQLSKDRYKVSQELAKLKEQNEQLRAAIGFELDKLRDVIEGIEGALY